MDSTTNNNYKLPSYEETTRSSNFVTIEVSDEDARPPLYSPCRLQRRKFHFDRYLSILGLLLSIIVGCGITAGTTYCLVKHVIRLISEAKVSSDPQVWMQEAKTKDYDSCYLGCNNCRDPEFAYNACIRTSEIHPQNSSTICDGRKMWNWAERYPEECLMARGEFYRLQALDGLKKSYSGQYALIILTVFAGIMGAGTVHMIWSRIIASNRRRVEEMRQAWPGWQNNRVRVRTRIPFKLSLAVFAMMFGCPINAYVCVGHDKPHNAYFANANNTIFVQAYGWFSNCYDWTSCTPICTDICYGNGGSCQQMCTTPCTTFTAKDRRPEDYVNLITPRIKNCGFRPVFGPREATDLRLANPGLEKNWWVQLNVNRYNVTNPTETDPEIICLHDIGNIPN
ncbi:hypothetical protein F4810DRAFT_720965 [Camillea tinctor]|nr:hypothetical protein F4810DRAFT_720965 [Camillea tinctor]